MKRYRIIGDSEIYCECSICEYSSKLADKKTFLCKKKGVVDGSYCCSKFVYDPLKRVPRTPPVIKKYEFETI